MDRETRKIMPFARALCLCLPETAVKINFYNGNAREVNSVVIVTRLWTGRPSLVFSGQQKIRLLGCEAAHYRYLVPRLRMSGTVPLILRYYFMAHTGKTSASLLET